MKWVVVSGKCAGKIEMSERHRLVTERCFWKHEDIHWGASREGSFGERK